MFNSWKWRGFEDFFRSTSCCGVFWLLRIASISISHILFSLKVVLSWILRWLSYARNLGTSAWRSIRGFCSACYLFSCRSSSSPTRNSWSLRALHTSFSWFHMRFDFKSALLCPLRFLLWIRSFLPEYRLVPNPGKNFRDLIQHGFRAQSSFQYSLPPDGCELFRTAGRDHDLFSFGFFVLIGHNPSFCILYRISILNTKWFSDFYRRPHLNPLLEKRRGLHCEIRKPLWFDYTLKN